MTLVPFSRFQAASKLRASDRARFLAALDVGSSKICCLIAETLSSPHGEDHFRIVGAGHHIARGTKAGTIVNPEEAEEAIRLAVDQAERMANITLNDVFVNVSGGSPLCSTHHSTLDLGGKVVTKDHIKEAIAKALRRCTPEGRVILHAIPVHFTLDNARGVENPEGLYARQLGVDVNVITVEKAPLRNLALVISRCHLSVSGFVVSPYAAAQGGLVSDELSLGSILIDLGGGTTNVAVFEEGNLVYAHVIPLGGQHITRDLAQGLSTSLPHAERLKTLSGSVLTTIWDEREFVSVPILGEKKGGEKFRKVPRSALSKIIRPRAEEIFELVRARLLAHTSKNLTGKRVILTGGGSQLTGIRDVAVSIFGKNVRVASPKECLGLPEMYQNQGFSVSRGLLQCALNPDHSFLRPNDFLESSPKIGYLKRVGQWIRESF